MSATVPETTGVVVVTGAVRGMGRACAERLRAPDRVVLMVDAHPDVDQVAEALMAGADGPGSVEAHRCDVTDQAGLAALAERVRQIGPLRSVVHAAGVSPTMGDWRQMFEVDLVGTVRVIHALEPLAIEGTAAVCFASSAAHLMPPPADPSIDALLDAAGEPDFLDRLAARYAESPLEPAYGYAKRGVIRFVGRRAAAWGRVGARICSLSPGIIDTPMGQQELSDQPFMEVMLQHTPLGRMGRPEEIAEVVAFFVSPAAAYMTGCDLLVDGGVTPTVAAAFGGGG